MAPASKKGSKNNNPRDRRSASRQSTPLSAIDSAPQTPQTATPTSAANTGMPRDTAYIHTSTAALVSNDSSIESIILSSSNNNSGGAPSAGTGNTNNNKPAIPSSDPPTARELHALHTKIKDTVNRFMAKRGEACERSMRLLAQKRKERIAMEREAQEVKSREEAVKVKKEKEHEDGGEGGGRKKGKKKEGGRKRSHGEMEVDGEEQVKEEEDEERGDSLPTVGAHGVARQDGVGLHEGAPAAPSPVISPRRPSVDLMDAAASPSDSETSQAEPPSTAPLYERAFGKDPTQFDDPTIYDIRELRDDMTLEEKKEILNVAYWPSSDLRDLTAGEPPDQDFSNAKPANQVNFSTFQTYVEPFIRPFTEEDVAFLKERGDRLTPYVIPQRGTRGYKEVWASEDGMDGVAPPRKQENDPNEARGSMEDMNDDTAETDEISMGPIMNRLLSIIRPSPNNASKKEQQQQQQQQQQAANNNNNEDADGDTTMVNGDADATATQDSQAQASAGAPPAALEEQKPTTYLPPDAPRLPANLNPAHHLPADYESLDQRAIQELRHLGFLGANDIQDFSSYAAHNDDEVAARLRTLQHELRRVSRANNIRKARVLELTEERMAMQEYANIADDLDNQVNAAYLKRNRSLAKPGSKKGGASGGGAGGAGRPGANNSIKGLGMAGGGRGVSDGVRSLMQKRRDWIEMVGPVVAYGRPPIPADEESIFDEASLRRLERGEREVEAGEGEGD